MQNESQIDDEDTIKKDRVEELSEDRNKILELNNTNLTKTSQNIKNNNNKKSNLSYDVNKFEIYNEQKKRYFISKKYNSNFHFDLGLKFMDRMKLDVYKRQTKDIHVNNLIELSKVRINNDEKLRTFNRLIDDANRRIKVKIDNPAQKASLFLSAILK